MSYPNIKRILLHHWEPKLVRCLEQHGVMVLGWNRDDLWSTPYITVKAADYARAITLCSVVQYVRVI